MKFVYRRLAAIAAVLALSVTGCVVDSPTGIDKSTNNNTPDATAADTSESPDPEEVPDDMTAVSGRVMDADTLQPIQGVLISTEPAIGTIITNGQGYYVLSARDFPGLTPGIDIRITATRKGYVQDSAFLKLNNGHQRNVDIVLNKAAAEFIIDASPNALQFTDNDFFMGAKTAQKQIKLKIEDGPTAQSQAYQTNVWAPPTQTWIQVSPQNGNIDGTPRNLTVTIDKTGLPAGMYTGYVEIVAEGGFQTIDVTLTVGATTQPTEDTSSTPKEDASQSEDTGPSAD